MKVIMIVHRSAGNESVGSMWHETFEFDESTTLKEAISKITVDCGNNYLADDIIIPVQRYRVIQ